MKKRAMTRRAAIPGTIEGPSKDMVLQYAADQMAHEITQAHPQTQRMKREMKNRVMRLARQQVRQGGKGGVRKFIGG